MPRKKFDTSFKRGPLVPKLPKSGFSEHMNISTGWHLSQWKRQAYRRPRRKIGIRHGDILQEESGIPWWIGAIAIAFYILINVIHQCSK